MGNPRTAFTIVELLVVVAIIGLLLGLFFPAALQVREAARRAACSNNSRRLAMAAQQFDSAFKKDPLVAGRINGAVATPVNSGDLEFSSYVLKIAPFLDVENQRELMGQRAKHEFPSLVLADGIDFALPASLPSLEILKCPSMTDPAAIENFSAGYPVRCRLDYMPCEGYFNTTMFENYRGRLNLSDRLAAKKGGASHTLLFGESQGEVVNNQRQSSYGYVYVPWGLFVNWAYDVDYSLVNPNPFLNPFRDLDGNRRYSIEQFSSAHPRVVIFSLCDGSVQAIDRSVSPEVIINMCSKVFGELEADYGN